MSGSSRSRIISDRVNAARVIISYRIVLAGRIYIWLARFFQDEGKIACMHACNVHMRWRIHQRLYDACRCAAPVTTASVRCTDGRRVYSDPWTHGSPAYLYIEVDINMSRRRNGRAWGYGDMTGTSLILK